MKTVSLIERFSEIRFGSRRDRRPEIQRIVVGRQAKNVIFQHPPSLFWWPELQVGEGARLEVSLAVNPAVRDRMDGQGEFTVWVAAGELGRAVCLERRILDPNSSSGREQWNDLSLDLTPWKGQFVRLGFQTELKGGSGDYAWLTWGEPVVCGVEDPAAGYRPISRGAVQLPPEHPHIFLITNDALRQDHLGCYGADHLRTPNLDRLAEEGVLFAQARSNSDSTLAAHAGLLTGRPPDVTGVLSEWGDFPFQLPNLATVLKGHGYETNLFSSEKEFTQGISSLAGLFDKVSPCLGNPAQSTSLTISQVCRSLEEIDWSVPQFLWLHLFEPHPPAMPDDAFARRAYPEDPKDPARARLSDRIRSVHAIETSLDFEGSLPLLRDGRVPYGLLQRLEDTVRFLKGERNSGPDFTHHFPSLFSEGWRGRSFEELVHWLGEETRRLRSEQVTGELLEFLEEAQSRLRISEQSMLSWMDGVVDCRFPEAMYAACVEESDTHLGTFFDRLRELGVWDSSCVVHTAPHGECLFESELTMEHHSPTEVVLRIPFLLKLPGGSKADPVEPGSRVEEPFQLIDVPGLILDVCGLGGGELLGGGGTWEAVVRGEVTPSLKKTKGAIISVGMQGGTFVIYRHPFKLLCVLGDGLSWVDGTRLRPGKYLYDCSSDDGERDDLASVRPEVVAELLGLVDAEKLSQALPREPLAFPERGIEISVGDSGESRELLRDSGQATSFLEDVADSSQIESERFRKWIRRVEKRLIKFTKERDYLLRQISQLRQAQHHLYRSKRWRISNVLKTLLQGKRQEYPPVDRLFKRIEERVERGGLSSDPITLWTRSSYVDQIKALRSRENETARVQRIQAEGGEMPKFLILISGGGRRREGGRLLASLREQAYPDWSFALVGEDSGVSGREEESGIEDPGGRCLEGWRESESWSHVMVLDSRDQLEPQALLWFAEAFCENRDRKICFADEDRLIAEDQWSDPFLKPDWSPDLMENMDATGKAVVFSREILAEEGPDFTWLEAGRIYRLVLSLTEVLSLRPHHLRRVLLHVHEPEPDNVERRNAGESQRVARELSQHADTIGESVWIEPLPAFGTVRMRRMVGMRRKVCIVIPTRDRLDLLERCVASIERQTAYESYEIIIVDNGTTDPATLRFLHHCGHRVKRIDGPFNYAAIHNEAVEDTDAEWLIFLNNDTEVIDPNWIEALAEYGQRPEIGAVGVRLLFPDHRIQHQGVILGIQARASHAFAGSLPNDAGARGQMQAARNFSAVTAACMFTRRSVFLEMGGYDTENFKIAYNDVDYCLRLWEAGYRVVCTPHTALIHYETSSRPNKDIPEEVAALQQKYLQDPDWIDPYYHPYLRQDFPNFVPDRIG